MTRFCDKERRDPVRAGTEEKYNQHHLKIRDNVERMFGVVKKRFQILLRTINMQDIEKATTIIESCFLLHNYLTEYERPLPQEVWSDIMEEDMSTVPMELVNAASTSGNRSVGVEIRDFWKSTIHSKVDKANQLSISIFDVINCIWITLICGRFII